ncbi:MAG: rod-binding protein [Lachnospiraceae bacterium]|nr:rod-binding protein [Lachnospiraceae bacterium]
MEAGNITGAYAEYYQAKNTASDKLSESITSKKYDAATNDELLGACKEFEAYFLEQVFKAMQKTVDAVKDDSNSTNYSTSVVDFFKDQTIASLASTSTENQGLGLAQSLYEQMKRNYNL